MVGSIWMKNYCLNILWFGAANVNRWSLMDNKWINNREARNDNVYCAIKPHNSLLWLWLQTQSTQPHQSLPKQSYNWKVLSGWIFWANLLHSNLNHKPDSNQEKFQTNKTCRIKFLMLKSSKLSVFSFPSLSQETLLLRYQP